MGKKACDDSFKLAPKHYVKMFHPLTKAEIILMQRRKRKEAIVKALVYVSVLSLWTWILSQSVTQTAIASTLCLIWECGQ